MRTAVGWKTAGLHVVILPHGRLDHLPAQGRVWSPCQLRFMPAYKDLKALIGALEVSANAPSKEDPLLRPFDLVCPTFHVIVPYLASRQLTKLPTCLREYTIGYCDSYLYHLSRDRATLRRALAHLESEERRAQLARRRAVNKKAAINLLPGDVLEEALLLSMVPLGEKIWSSPQLKTCHHWREVAKCAPRIWSHLYITREIPVECINLRTMRSAEAPLHVHFAAPCSFSSFLPSGMEKDNATLAPLPDPYSRIGWIVVDKSDSPDDLQA
jgi:hypothetical protein